MMFEEDRTHVARAYTSLPDSPGYGDSEADLEKAIAWCYNKADGDFHRIGIQASKKEVIDNEPLLAGLARHGASLHFDSRGKITSLPSGPVLVYRPQPETLWQIEEGHCPEAIVAAGITGPENHRRTFSPERRVGAQPWVTAYKPEHLGGPAIEAKEPIVPDPIAWVALKTFTNSINSSTGLSHSSDHSLVVDGLTKLRAAGHTFDPDDLLAGALALNWKGSTAVELRDLARELNSGKRKRYRPILKANIIKIWEDEAAARDPAAQI